MVAGGQWRLGARVVLCRDVPRFVVCLFLDFLGLQGAEDLWESLADPPLSARDHRHLSHTGLYATSGNYRLRFVRDNADRLELDARPDLDECKRILHGMLSDKVCAPCYVVSPVVLCCTPSCAPAIETLLAPERSVSHSCFGALLASAQARAQHEVERLREELRRSALVQALQRRRLFAEWRKHCKERWEEERRARLAVVKKLVLLLFWSWLWSLLRVQEEIRGGILRLICSLCVTRGRVSMHASPLLAAARKRAAAIHAKRMAAVLRRRVRGSSLCPLCEPCARVLCVSLAYRLVVTSMRSGSQFHFYQALARAMKAKQMEATTLHMKFEDRERHAMQEAEWDSARAEWWQDQRDNDWKTIPVFISSTFRDMHAEVSVTPFIAHQQQSD